VDVGLIFGKLVSLNFSGFIWKVWVFESGAVSPKDTVLAPIHLILVRKRFFLPFLFFFFLGEKICFMRFFGLISKVNPFAELNLI